MASLEAATGGAVNPSWDGFRMQRKPRAAHDSRGTTSRYDPLMQVGRRSVSKRTVSRWLVPPEKRGYSKEKGAGKGVEG